MKYLFIIFGCSVFVCAQAQQFVLNGDFEMHGASGCTYNVENEEFNDLMEHVFAFGNNSEMDIHADNCGYALPPSGGWFVSLSQRPSGPVDAISLELDQPLETGEVYQLSYLDWAETSGIDNIPLPLEIGVSVDTFSFGEPLFSAIPISLEWTSRSFDFVAPNNGRFITLQMAGKTGLKGWTFVDNFKLALLTPVEETTEVLTSVYPNPSTGWLSIETAFIPTSIKVLDLTGRVLKTVGGALSYKQTIDIGHLANGLYLLEISGEEIYRIEKIQKR